MPKTARKPRPAIPLESEVLKDCIATLKRLSVPHWRRNVAAVTAEYKGKRRFIRAGQPGQSDIWGLILPNCTIQQHPTFLARHFELEIKRPKQRPTLDQVLWLRSTNLLTGASFWVDDPVFLEKVMLALQRGGLIAYQDGTQRYGGIDGPTSDYDVEMPG